MHRRAGLLLGATLALAGGEDASAPATPVPATTTSDGTESTRWLVATEPTRAVVVVAHGLNLRPSRMDAIAELLREHGADVLRLGLPGHVGGLEEMRGVTRDAWLRALAEAGIEASVRATQLQVPLSFVGYSVGGLLYCDSQSSTPAPPPYARVVLLAPALTPNRLVHLTPLMGLFRGERYVIASEAPPESRRHAGTSVRAYKAVLASLDAVEAADGAAYNVPTWVLIDRDDETVSATRLAQFIARKALTAWTLEVIDRRGEPVTPIAHHLIIDRQSLGTERWPWLGAKVVEHLGLESSPKRPTTPQTPALAR